MTLGMLVHLDLG